MIPDFAFNIPDCIDSLHAVRWGMRQYLRDNTHCWPLLLFQCMEAVELQNYKRGNFHIIKSAPYAMGLLARILNSHLVNQERKFFPLLSSSFVGIPKEHLNTLKLGSGCLPPEKKTSVQKT